MTTGAAKMYATTIEPRPPGARLSEVDDWKKRMSAGEPLFTQQMWVTVGSPVLQAWSPAAGLREPDR